MSSINAGRFNFGFFLFSLAVLSSTSADTNSNGTNTTAAGEIPEWSKESKPTTEELPVDKLNFISSTSQKDNSIDGDFILSTRANYNVVATTVLGENEGGNLSTTEASGDSEAGHNASIQSKSITTPETNNHYNLSIPLEITATPIDDQTVISSTDTDVSYSAKVNTTSDPVQNNSFKNQENNSPQFTGNLVDDATDNWSENKTTSANTKPTKVTIMGIGVKKVISVSLRLKDTKIIGPNVTDVETDYRNSTYNSSSDAIDIVNVVPSDVSFSDSVENLTESINQTESSTVATQNNSEFSVLKFTTETDIHNNTEMRSNASDTNAEETVFTSEQPIFTVTHFNDSTEVRSDPTQNSTEAAPSWTDNSRTESQLNATEINPAENVTGPTEEPFNITGVSTKHDITDVSLSGNTTTDVVTEISVSRTSVEINDTSSITTRLESPPTSTGSPSTSTEIGNTTNMDMTTTTSKPLIRYAGIMKIVNGLSWSVELGEKQTPLYKKTAKRIQLLLEEVFAGKGLLREVEIDGFSNGSVVVDYYVTFVESDVLNSDYLVHTFNSYFKNNNTFGDFTIDPRATHFEVAKIKAVQPTAEPQVKPLLPQWVVAVVVIAAASLVFIILFAAVTIYGRHYGRRSYNKKLQGDEIIFDKPDYQSGPRLSDAAYENLAADAVYDVESSPEKSDVMIGSPDYQFDSWRSNRLARIPSTKRFSFNSS